MPEYVLQRNHTHRSTLGVISFTKGEPAWVPPIMEKEIIAIGGERVDGDKPDVLDPEKVEEVPLSFQDRRTAIFAAFELISERNESKDFTGAGVPTVKSVEKITEFDVDRNELVEFWGEYRAEKAEAQ